MLKKVLIGLLAAMIVAVPLVGCGGGNTETTDNVVTVESTGEWIKEDLDKELNVWWQIPENWEKKDTKNSTLTQYHYYPDGIPENYPDTTNFIDLKIFKLDNEFLTHEQAEDYINFFAEDFYGNHEGYENVNCYEADITGGTHTSDITNGPLYGKIPLYDVHAARCTFDFDAGYGIFSVNTYCFLYDEDRVLTIEYWHNNEAVKDYSDVFDTVIDGVHIPELILEEDTANAGKESDEDKYVEKVAPRIGMTEKQVLNSTWGSPNKRNVDEYAWGVEEQWVYDDMGYIYFENGIVTAIQHR